jgi:hypothetical protein
METRNQRKFFDDFAGEKGFEPLQAEKWYKITYEDVIKKKVLVHYCLNFQVMNEFFAGSACNT